MAIGDEYFGLSYRPKARHWLRLGPHPHPIRRGLASYLPILQDPGGIGGDQRDLSENTPDADLVWDAVGGDAMSLEEHGDIYSPDGSTQYLSYAPAGGYPATLLPQPGEPYTLFWFGRWLSIQLKYLSRNGFCSHFILIFPRAILSFRESVWLLSGSLQFTGSFIS